MKLRKKEFDEIWESERDRHMLEIYLNEGECIKIVRKKNRLPLNFRKKKVISKVKRLIKNETRR